MLLIQERFFLGVLRGAGGLCRDPLLVFITYSYKSSQEAPTMSHVPQHDSNQPAY